MAGGDAGGIRALLDLIEEHRGALEYDWRSRFGLPLSAVGASMDYGEAMRLAHILSSDPSSQLGAVLQGWEFSISRETLALYDLHDLEGTKAAGSKWKARPGRPFSAKGESRVLKRGDAGGRTPEEVRAILRSLGHTSL